MDTKTITKIIELMTESDLTEFDIEQEGLKLRIKRGFNGPSIGQVASSPVVTMTQAPQPSNTAPAAPLSDEGKDQSFECIKSPIVGTFYEAPSPDKPAFIKVGDKVEQNTPVCIIEAMKVMNEIQAEITGTITEVLVKNGETVEYGQPIFRVKPS